MPSRKATSTHRSRTDKLAAQRHLVKADPRLARVIRKYGPCPLKRTRGGFERVCKAIVSQQLSTKAAATIFRRFCALSPRKKPTAITVAKLTDQQLREVGLSRQKIGYLRDLARTVTEKKLVFERLGKLSDEQVIEQLTQVKGIGRWTAEMYLIFVLGRPDVFSVGDLGIRTAIRNLYKLDHQEVDLDKFAERWKPHRSTACWYLWRSLENE
ncbi:MAG: DNA-3-methyladenine glycosylase 2 family protein [candidate division Zixibacteria bacterium]|nr:DNA-3-methyladenine glycosylase 2 family protein [candidate division Zixibacteria bacterium]